MIANNILLIGFMGVGKGRVARELASMTGSFAVDTDDLIESFTNTEINKIFKNQGEIYFRTLEQRVAKWLEHQVTRTVISTGGGFFAVENLNNIGTVVFLKAGFAAILQEMQDHPRAKKKIKKRPLIRDFEKAKALFDRRQPLYLAKADIVVNVVGKGSAEIAREILAGL